MRVQNWLTKAMSIIAICLWLWTIPSPAAQSNPVQTDHVQVQLISEVLQAQSGSSFWVALHFQIEEGWHIYWKNPGDSGASTTIDWQLPEGITASEIIWPAPQRLPAGPLINFGYKEEVYLPVAITPEANLTTYPDIPLQAEVDWLVCKIDCIPESASVTLTVPVADTAPIVDTQWQSGLETTRQTIPQPSPWPVTATIAHEILTLQVAVSGLSPETLESAVFFPNQDGVIVNASPQNLTIDERGLTLKIQQGYLNDLSEVTGVLVIKESLASGIITRALEIESPVRTPIAIAPTSKLLNLWQVMGLAFLGGIILNLMPCVFPVLSVKALSIVQKAEKKPQQVRWQAIAFTSGILTSFTVLVAVLLGLRSLGQQIGWGFQLQSPGFVTLMAYLMFAVGLSLSGFFVFGASVMGIGQSLANQSGYQGEFFSGVFATVVATPCTAPFMATAIGIALTQSLPVAIVIFEMLGLGMALPYLILSFTPGLQLLLPKPGPWMETFQQLLAFPMYGATAWLIWVLTLQTGTTGLAVVLTGLILIAFAIWIQQKTQLGSLFWRRTGTIIALMFFCVTLTLTQIPQQLSPQATQVNTSSQLPWETYSAQRLEELRAARTPVFVNFSASWCITCLVNEQVVLNQPKVIVAFEHYGVVHLKGDWTNRDPAITEALEAFERSGVPLYVAYPTSPKAEPIILPQILISEQVIQVLKKL